MVDTELGEGPDLGGHLGRRSVHRVERLATRVELDSDPGGEPRHRPAGGLGGSADDRDPWGVRRRLSGGCVVRVGDPADTAKGALVAGAEPDRQRRTLRWQRLEGEVVELVETPTERLGAARPQVAADRDRLVAETLTSSR